MTAPYTIDYHPDRAILEVVVRGFWDAATARAFAADMAATMGPLKQRGAMFGIIGDGRDFPVQGQEVAHALAVLIDADNQVARAPTAIVAGSALVRLQATRAMAAPHVTVVATRDEAEAWLATRKEAP